MEKSGVSAEVVVDEMGENKTNCHLKMTINYKMLQLSKENQQLYFNENSGFTRFRPGKARKNPIAKYKKLCIM